MGKSTTTRNRRKVGKSVSCRPPKPYKDFPLTPHPAGYWCKTIKSKLHYFGRWGQRRNGKMERIEGDGWKEALELYEQQKDALYAGRTPRPTGDGLTIMALCNRFLTSKKRLLDNGEIVARTFSDYKRITDRLMGTFGKSRLVDDLVADDFEELRADIAKTCGPVRLGGEIQQIRMVFKYGYDAGLIEKPVRYGQNFKKPSKRVLRKHRNGNGERMFEADEIRTMVDAAGEQLKAMILLGINCGFGNADCGTLPTAAVDLDAGWIKFPRPKTGIDRRCPLWPETVEALKAVIESRPTPKDKEHDGLVFVTKYGGAWAKQGDVKEDKENGGFKVRSGSANPISAETRKLLQSLGLYKKGRTFYALRHTFETIGGESRDQIAVNFIMGHVDDSMSAVYRERISDDRLRDVVNHVHCWLFDGGQDDE